MEQELTVENLTLIQPFDNYDVLPSDMTKKAIGLGVSENEVSFF